MDFFAKLFDSPLVLVYRRRCRHSDDAVTLPAGDNYPMVQVLLSPTARVPEQSVEAEVCV
jgi:hypothetical protein